MVVIVVIGNAIAANFHDNFDGGDSAAGDG